MTQDDLRQALHYDPDTGAFTWLIKPCKNIAAGAEAGSVRPDGYRLINVYGKRYYAHRLAFLYMNGEMPDMVDHINRVTRDNRWCNLRPTCYSRNAMNSKTRKDNTSGHTGVVMDKRTGKYYARYANRHIGTFPTKREAVEASHRAAARAGT